jgi:hypothetical protein
MTAVPTRPIALNAAAAGPIGMASWREGVPKLRKIPENQQFMREDRRMIGVNKMTGSDNSREPESVMMLGSRFCGGRLSDAGAFRTWGLIIGRR